SSHAAAPPVDGSTCLRAPSRTVLELTPRLPSRAVPLPATTTPFGWYPPIPFPPKRSVIDALQVPQVRRGPHSIPVVARPIDYCIYHRTGWTRFVMSEQNRAGRAGSASGRMPYQKYRAFPAIELPDR